jgi:superfamily II DNA or RNA helicase
VNDVPRNEMIANDIVRAVESGRCPLLLTGRTEHLQYFAAKLAGVAKHVFVLKGGMGKKQRRETAAALAAVPENESRVILATGSYIGEGFDDARLDTLFLAMPISWKGTLQQYVGRLHRLHDNKRFVPGLRLRGQLRRFSDAGQDVRAQAEGLQRPSIALRTDTA